MTVSDQLKRHRHPGETLKRYATRLRMSRYQLYLLMHGLAPGAETIRLLREDGVVSETEAKRLARDLARKLLGIK